MANVHYGLGVALKKLGRSQKAAQEFIRAVEEYREQIANNPPSIETYIRLGNALIELENSAEAAVYFRKAVDLNPTILDN